MLAKDVRTTGDKMNAMRYFWLRLREILGMCIDFEDDMNMTYYRVYREYKKRRL